MPTMKDRLEEIANAPKKTVKIVKPCRPQGANFTHYQPGDIAGFPPDVAERLISAGAAVPYTAPRDKQSDGPTARRTGRRSVTKG